MAIVANKDGGGIIANGSYPGTDRKYSDYNRTNAGSPIGSLVPMYTNELVLDTTNSRLWRAIGATNADWSLVASREVQ